MNILLLNPPGEKLYVRDYYCSKVSKANYIYQPVDLLILSGILGLKHRVSLIDAIVERLSPKDCLSKIVLKKPDAIVALTGSVSIKEDIVFFTEIKKQLNCPIYASGDVLMEKGAEFLSHNDSIDGIILDFTNDAVLSLVEGTDQPLEEIIYKKGGAIIKDSGNLKRGEFEIPVPKHEIFLNKRYSYPFISSFPFATVLTDYGCPYRCSFCIMGTLPYKYRSADNVIKELEYLHQFGIKEIYFSDQTFGAIKPRALKLCRAMTEKKFDFGWVCFSRADLTDESMLEAMKAARCHTIIYGVESGSNKLLQLYNKDITKDILRRTFSICKSYGIRTVGTFIIGLPEDDEKSILETISFAKELECDYASFNIYVPRMRTRLREEIQKYGINSEVIKVMDQSGSYCVIDTRYLTKSEVLKLKNRAVRDFYFRPSYILKRFLQLSSIRDFKRESRAGLEVLRDIIKGYLHR